MPRILAPLAIAALLPLAAQAGTPLEEALAASQDGPLYAFTLNLTADGVTSVMTIDPSKPQGERVTVLSPAEAEWSEDFAKRVENMQENSEGDIWCASLAGNVPADATLVSETDTTATYKYTPVESDDEDDDLNKIVKHLKGTVTVDKVSPGILSLQMVAEKPFKPMAVAKIKKFEMKVACDRAPDGRMHIASLDMSLAGSALMQAFSQSDRQTITDLVELPGTQTGTR